MKILLGGVMAWIALGCWGTDSASEEDGAAPQPVEVVDPDLKVAEGPGGLAQQTLERSGRAPEATSLDDPAPGTQASCRALMQRQRACSAAFIPALVDARVERDEPAGIFARAHEIGREALVAEALEEWKADSRDEAIDGVCAEIARTIAPARVSELERSVGTCLQRSGCEAFVACAVPVNLDRWTE
jgi:hypothetical protein